MTNFSLPDDLLYVDVYNKKYTIIQRATGSLFFLRHGEPWDAANNSDWKHAGLILALAQDLSNGGGSWKRHVESAIYELRKAIKPT